jgi:hypothetical protein
MGLDIYLYKGKECIENTHPKYTDHYFKIGYFRSSYNGGGINNVLSNLGIPTLYYIFSAKDKYKFKPDWNDALVKCNEVYEALKAKPNLRCFEVGWNEFFGSPDTATITSEAEALEAYAKESRRDTTFKEGYSNAVGHFYPSGLKVFGLISGAKKRFFVDQKLPCTFVVMEGENEWYLQALEIVKDTIEFVLSQKDKSKYSLHWSG